MGLFTKDKYVPKEFWSIVVVGLTKDFYDLREEFYTSCLSYSNELLNGNKHNLRCVNGKLGGGGEKILKAVQLLYTIIQCPSYIPPNKGKEFTTLLYHSICRADYQDILNIMKELNAEDNEENCLAYYTTIGSLLAKYICGYEAKQLFENYTNIIDYIEDGIPDVILGSIIILGNNLITSCFPFLTAQSHLIIAKNFHDKDRFDEIIKEIENEHEEDSKFHKLHYGWIE
jgi:hypothetical protein